MANIKVNKSGTLSPFKTTKAEAIARQEAKELFHTPEMDELGWDAYKALLKANNPMIVADWANRKMGKVKDEIEHSNINDPLADVATATLKAWLMNQPKIKEINPPDPIEEEEQD